MKGVCIRPNLGMPMEGVKKFKKLKRLKLFDTIRYNRKYSWTLEVRRIKTQHAKAAYQFSIDDSPALPISLVDPSGLIPGDVREYKSDGSKSANFFIRTQKTLETFRTGDLSQLHNSAIKYSHASLEINVSQQYSADGRGAHIIESNRAILFNEGNHQGRSIDIYRHYNSAQFNGDALTRHSMEYSIAKGNYGVDGWCSQRTEEGLRVGGLNLDNRSISTPHGLSTDSHLIHIGTYNTGHTYTSPSGHTYSAPQSELPKWGVG